MYANKAVPCWMVFDEGYVGRYVSGANPLKKRRMPEELIERGAVMRADTIGDLARQIDVPADELEHTIARFNEFAAKGLDPDFGRGPVGVQRLPRRPRVPAQRRGRPARPRAVLRDQGACRPTSGRAGE